MATADQDLVEISVFSGRTSQPQVYLHPGVTMNPTSVGSSGDWSVVADGVAPVHVYIAFDGKDVFVAAAPNSNAVLAGTPLTTQWTTASIPCELRFAGACLLLRKVSREQAAQGAGPADGAFAATAHDGGALLKAAQRAVDVAMRMQGRPTGAGLASTVVMPDAPRQGPFEGAPPSTMRMNDRPLSPFGARASEGAPPRAAVGSSPGIGEARAASGAAGLPGAVEGSSETEGEEPPKKDNGFKAYWKTASAVKKISLVLMPFALYLSYWALRDPLPAAPPRLLGTATSATTSAKTGASASAKMATPPPVASAAGGIGPASDASGHPGVPAGAASASSGSSASSGAPEPVAPATPAPARIAKADAGAPKLAPGRHTADRDAIDAVANGSYDDAARRYAALSAAHPDGAAYKEAARILADKAGRPH